MYMSFNNNYNNNNGGYNNNQQQTGEKKKTNFKIAKVWGSDGCMDVTTWVADTGVKTILSIKSAVGKDPSTGANVYEQKMPNELPRFFMNIDPLRAVIDALDGVPVEQINLVYDKGHGDKLTIVGSATNVKITIDSAKNGSRSMTIDSFNLNGKNVHAAFANFVEYLKICYKKSLFNKLDPDEFGMVSGSDEELPI